MTSYAVSTRHSNRGTARYRTRQLLTGGSTVRVIHGVGARILWSGAPEKPELRGTFPGTIAPTPEIFPTPLLKRFSNRPCTTLRGGRGTSARTDAGGPMRAYSMDLRERALLDSDAGMTAADVAAKYRVSGSWVRLLKQRRRETGRGGASRPATGTARHAGAAPAHLGRSDCGAPGSHAG